VITSIKIFSVDRNRPQKEQRNALKTELASETSAKPSLDDPKASGNCNQLESNEHHPYTPK